MKLSVSLLTLLLLAAALIATTPKSDGGPIATCRPGVDCGPDDYLRN